MGQLKTTKRKQKDPNRPTHRKLNTGFRNLGQSMSDKSEEGDFLDITIKAPKGFKGGQFKSILKEGKVDTKSFPTKYRQTLDKHDELVSTSSVREMISGFVKQKGKISTVELTQIERVFENVSKVRLKTKHSGFSVDGEWMQHPTSEGEGFFGSSKKSMSKHYILDLGRRNSVYEAMKEESEKDKSTIETIANAGIRAGIAYTLNEFTAPITANDVKPFSSKSNKKDTDLMDQVRAREEMKSIFVSLGGTQDEEPQGSKPEERLSRSWQPRRGLGKRSVSPSRFPPPPKDDPKN